VTELRTYEALYIIRPDVQDDEVQTIAKDVESMVTAAGGVIVRSEIWGKRRLAYEVQKCSEGNYVLLRFEAEPEFVARLENYFRLTDSIIRYLVVHFDEKTLRLEASQKKRKEAEIRHEGGSDRPGDRRDRDDDDDDEPRRGRRYSRRDDDDRDDDE
jgi:small subunit ribosomal protein S6